MAGPVHRALGECPALRPVASSLSPRAAKTASALTCQGFRDFKFNVRLMLLYSKLTDPVVLFDDGLPGGVCRKAPLVFLSTVRLIDHADAVGLYDIKNDVFYGVS